MQHKDFPDFLKENGPNLALMLAAFTEATGILAQIVDRSGYPRVGAREERHPRFCQVVRASGRAKEKCAGCYARAGDQAFQIAQPYIFRCHAGLILWAAAVVHNEQHVATVICGQVLMWEPEEFFWTEIARMTRDLDVSVPDLVEAAMSLPVMSPRKVQAAADLLFLVTNSVMTSGLTVMEQKRKLAEQEAMMGEGLAPGDLGGRPSRDWAPVYLVTERDLFRAIVKGNEGDALAALGSLFRDIASQPSGIEEVRRRALEVLLLLSRAAQDFGVAVDSPAICRASQGIMGSPDPDGVAEQAERASSALVIDMLASRGVAGDPVQRAIWYIRQNFNKALELEDIATFVHLSPGHLCHLFKAKTGSTILEYTTGVRMERSKQLLESSNLSVAQIGASVGYREPGYFSRTFKKNVGMNPSAYRRMFSGSLPAEGAPR